MKFVPEKDCQNSLMDLLTKDSHPGVAGSFIDQRADICHAEGGSRNMADLVNVVHDRDVGTVASASSSFLLEGDIDIGPDKDLQFESHEAAYKFYQEYAKSMGFTTSIKNSRRSKKSKDFIDAKFACSRYGATPESDIGSSRRPGIKKTDCKASMHVKRNKYGKWVIHEFIKEHNHELLPALAYYFRIHRNVKMVEKNNIDILHAVSERTKKMYVDMSRQSASFLNDGFLRDAHGSQFDKGNQLVLDEGDAQFLLDYFMCVKKENPKFFYAVHLNEEQYLRNFFWVDAKSRSDYSSFSDVVSLDTSYIRTNDKLPLVLFVGVNHHFQTMLLGCALIAEELTSTFVWLLKTWVRAMGGGAPQVIITDQHPSIKSAIQEIFPDTRHCFHLCNVLEKVPENLAHVTRRHENFHRKFNKCIFKSWSDEQFELRWWKMVTRFDLQEDDWVRSLYEDRKKWVPLYMSGIFLAGMSPAHRSESVNSFFDKYIQRKLTLKEFVKQYGVVLQNRYEEEAIADFDTLHKQPALKSPSPWEKQMSIIYTHAIFKKFQVEVLGVVGCHPKKEGEDGTSITYRVEDCEKAETFFVAWDETKSQVSCLCRSFEYKGFLCRHAMLVLQICGISSIPSQYILRRWTKDAKTRQLMVEGTERLQTRAQRYVSLCKQAIGLSEEGSLTQDSHSIALRTLVDTLKNCVSMNNIHRSATELGDSYCAHDIVQTFQENISTRTSKKKNVVKKRKVASETDVMLTDAEDNLHHMENLSSDGISLNGYYGSQPNVPGLVQLNLMEPPHDSYYVDQESMQGLGQLNSIGPNHEGFFGAQQSVHGLGHLDFRPSSSFSYSLQDEHNLRSTELRGDASRHT
ncbi:protein FAR-RED IMPAIRED RESPONSE 1 isoform X1 [Beta vulgaris subsp. vulgaris]|uniref:protein FAR-RED IMPAIRED RESPONSE 1 isoform X1 n=2 Tax=Beta vulgaris subsp. vulgaris TaxID=3555 RepID=UPI002036EAE4|nr:protein FAR-RED IMPAIRED RESPONSE 1 isoform X1 [Beta vulgaris subsp. vulgaris]XP_057249861.1 protein FAR-RED IMPAIRED RESPONSE 1 isoform X1 [Beta vulgaris subsp. vulgaris]XP_057249862.1 protein FAR-RED IMPAIRED RESPONSE 1 isoform X1 [Beta vulgaris subsp. vulgaris]XP_057249863.1 protein FAR-RED IMPAIRED RESPONSE 1 isoform X1 [Beta vulgaris subsp. vulgaris]XP_057249864.1 protein FAR-RED IMPAIRED RESPONSE 1 isoform X1 [Beta vulgaris subsp. vulgaris]XP_057249865.1 protein FAR-RED IMPAIRED RESPO